jgi:hypothetical protein
MRTIRLRIRITTSQHARNDILLRSRVTHKYTAYISCNHRLKKYYYLYFVNTMKNILKTYTIQYTLLEIHNSHHLTIYILVYALY